MKNDIRKYREAEGIIQGDLADAVGVSRQTINTIERDRYDPSLELAFKLAAHFHEPGGLLRSVCVRLQGLEDTEVTDSLKREPIEVSD